MLYSEKIKSCKKKWLHYGNCFPHSSERKTVTVTKIVVGSKEDQHQSLHYNKHFPQEYYAVKFPVKITEKNSLKQKKRYVIILSPMVIIGTWEGQGCRRGTVLRSSLEFQQAFDVSEPEDKHYKPLNVEEAPSDKILKMVCNKFVPNGTGSVDPPSREIGVSVLLRYGATKSLAPAKRLLQALVS